MIEIIPNFFTEEKIKILQTELEKNNWLFVGTSASAISAVTNPVFWYKELGNTKAIDLFLDTIQQGINRKVVIERLYVNGQAHGQCGVWHVDVPPGSNNSFTVIYFHQKWLPEYGGHLLVRTDPITSVLPEYNKAVLINSAIEHIGLEPTRYCLTQRETIACKFKVIN